VAEGEANLAVQQEELAARTQGLQELEASLQERETSLQEREASLQEKVSSLQEREAKVEEFLAERSASTGQIVRWVGEVNPSLDALGLSPIQVAEAPPPLGAVLRALDSTAERLRHVETAFFDLLETEGRAVARGMAEYILTCFRSHDPACSLTPVLVGPVRAKVAAAQEGVQEAADMVATHVRCHPGPKRGGASSSDHQHNRSSIFVIVFVI
jgi:hypothetical protein